MPVDGKASSAKSPPVRYMHRDITAKEQHAHDASGIVPHRLMDDVHEQLLRLFAMPADPEL